MKSLARAALRAAVVVTALAGHAAAHPDDPKFWCWDAVAGAATGPQFTQMVRIDLLDGGVPRGGDDVAYEAVEMIKNLGLVDGEVAIQLFGFGQGGSSHPSAYYTSTVPLWFHQADAASYSGDHPECTPWMDSGIIATSNWVDDFIAEYQARQTYYAGLSIDIPNPSRLILDTEQTLLWFDTHDSALFDYIRFNDSRWDDPAFPVPGFPGQTLEDLFLAAPAAVQSYTAGELPTYSGNQAWFVWYVNICEQAMEAAMNEAVYSRFRSAWNGIQCSDYDASLRIDGTNGRYYRGACSGVSWQAYSWWGYGQLQAPELYWVGPAWSSGTVTITDVIVRHRNLLDSIIQSMTAPSGETVTPWITVPDIAFSLCGGYPSITESDTRRILALTRAKGISEYNLWSSTPPDGTEYGNFIRAKDWVWGADLDSHTVLTGTETVGSVSNGAHYSNSDTLEVESTTAGVSEFVVIDLEFISEFDDTTTQLILNTEFWFQGGSPVNAAVQMYNWDIPDWVNITNAATTTSRQIRSNVVSSAASYIDSGGEMRVRIIASSGGAFTLNTDLVQVVKEAE